MKKKHNRAIVPAAKALRKNMTREERRLWYGFLRTYPVRFCRQKIIGPYIVDFYCFRAKLAIELDGSQHYREDGLRRDAVRTAFLEDYGLTVIRLSNNEIDQNFSGVCEYIDQTVKQAIGSLSKEPKGDFSSGMENRKNKEKTRMFAVAIDGPAGAGKSSVAKAAAQRLGFVYVDTGALYRTLALYLLDRGIDSSDPAAVEAALPGVEVGLEYGPEGQKMFLCGEDVTGKIRTPEVSMAASNCSAIPAVRAFLLDLQRELAAKNNVLMDGRDIGTVVLPGAQLKVFLTASPEERARRRVKQLEEAGQKADLDDILRDIQQRDYQDSHREAAPLKQAEDAVLLDTSHLTFEEAVETLMGLVEERR